ncbi:Ail/Lom family outer membrane beta-barrel protein [Acinetobacter faecalis]|uniref:Ail/Lom family outer membrane beta-barrel protein n=1 Tax=Acinetobacter faecalis TaxID=2665161 RepID=UPI002A91660D|nr:Ail/Lom family outer membrane beta-barrel protein [Acinetobacter faecalis]MDY6451089.1 Ail/Lom family outer membrane beta-barrel protein [Acinetobacter faecalis]
MLNKTVKLGLLVAAVATSSSVFADNHSFSLGYAQSKISDIDLKGVNAQYRYEWNSPFSLISSISYLKGDVTEQEYLEIYNTDIKYFSYMMGPAYRFNNYVSVYATTGISNIKVKSTDIIGANNPETDTISKTEFAYGAGVIVNPTQNVTVNVGYEGTSWKHADEKRLNLNGWNVSLGYRF